MSQETHAGTWIGFRQPVNRVSSAEKKRATPVEKTHEANPGEVWEESEFWVDVDLAASTPTAALRHLEAGSRAKEKSRPRR